MHFSEIMIFSSRFGDVIYATELGLVPDELLVNDLRPLLTQAVSKRSLISQSDAFMALVGGSR